MIKSNELFGVNERINDVLKITNNYNYEDLVRAIFCINICIKNRSALSSQMTLNLSLLEYKKCGNLRINNYSEFKDFFSKIENILQITHFDDYIIEDFGEVRFKYRDKYYKVIIGTGHNLVCGQLFCLESLAKIIEKGNELEEIFKYNSNIIEYFEKFNKSDEKREIRFEIPSEILFNKVQEFFNTELKKINLDKIKKVFENENAPVEKRYFVEKDNSIYPLYNTAILVDLFDIWYKQLSDNDKRDLADISISKILSDISILDQGEQPNIMYPVSLIDNGGFKSKYIYSFVIKCDKGAIIGINREQFENNMELDKEINMIQQYHKNNKLNLGEIVKRNGNEYCLGVTITKECDVHFILYDSFVNISEIYQRLVERDKKYYECSALDLIYMLLFMEDQDELLKYISEKSDGDYEQIFGFGGDSSRFLMWKDSGHMLVQGALQYGMIDIGYTEENDYVLDYFKNTLKDFPFDCKDDFLFRSPFIWQIKEAVNGELQYVNKIKKNFGGILIKLDNGGAVFFVHNVEFYKKQELKEEYFNRINLIDDLNLRKIKRIKEILSESKNLKNKLIEVMFMPSNYGKKVKIRMEDDRKYVYSDLYEDSNTINIRYMVNYPELQKDIMNAENRTIENQYYKELFKPLNNSYKVEYEKICKVLDEENDLKKEVDVFAIEIDYIYNMSLELYNVKEIDYLNAKKEIAKICLESNIEPGEYFGKEANKVIRNMQQKLIEHFESRIKQFNRIDIHKKLTEICANTYNSINVHKKRFNSFNNIDETVLNEVQLKTIKDREQEKHNLRVILYFIESNLFLERESKREITQEELNELLAFSNWLVVLSDNADICYFTDSEAHINVNFDYVVDTFVEDNDNKKIDEFNRRVYSSSDYTIKGDETDMKYLEKTKEAFHIDTSIELINLFDVCFYFQRYAIENNKCIKFKDNVYSISEVNLISDIQERIKKTSNEVVSEDSIKKAIEFLTIDVSKLKCIKGKTDYYLPIGERRKRDNRFDIKPLLNENGSIIFSPVIVSNVKEQWKNGLLDNYLPYEIGLDNTVKSLIEWKKRYEKEMVFDIQRIFQNQGISYVKTNVELHKIDKNGGHPLELGDYDILAIDDSKLKIWIIESKVLKKVGSFFEMFNQQRGFFLDHKDDEDFQRRIDYIEKNYKKILRALQFDTSNNYKILPYMVMNKVMGSRYKKIKFPIISIGELEDIIKNENS